MTSAASIQASVDRSDLAGAATQLEQNRSACWSAPDFQKVAQTYQALRSAKIVSAAEVFVARRLGSPAGVKYGGEVATPAADGAYSVTGWVESPGPTGTVVHSEWIAVLTLKADGGATLISPVVLEQH